MFFYQDFLNKDGSRKMNFFPNEFIFMLEGCLYGKKNMAIFPLYPIITLSRLEYFSKLESILHKSYLKKFQMIPWYLFLDDEQKKNERKERHIITYNPKKIKDIITFIQTSQIKRQSPLHMLQLSFIEVLAQGFTKDEAKAEILRKIIMSKEKISFYDVGISLDKFILFQKADQYLQSHQIIPDIPYKSKLYVLKTEYLIQWKQLLEVVIQIEYSALELKQYLESNIKQRKEIENIIKKYQKRFYIDPVCMFLNPQMTYEQIYQIKKINKNFLKNMPFLYSEFGIPNSKRMK